MLRGFRPALSVGLYPTWETQLAPSDTWYIDKVIDKVDLLIGLNVVNL